MVTPDAAGRLAVLGGFGALNLLVLATAGVLRLKGRGARAARLAQRSVRSARVVAGPARTDDLSGGNA
ncbi:hypothetical protein [Raineyella sp. LH-20]|uniref:hypothetical protein n=1 Tax=Raineyella sp. LH-20 TaxID=3081204 RepID=UPI002954F5BC|nr:hypothetical protein [Raineyella sp. LH-20]WOP18846.1 hypothetical protein R0146_00815 [Raineyella sp. LH-20]